MNYIIGDIQGCYQGLKRLLKTVHFNPNNDYLWAVGDLVARGEDSLSTIQFLYDLGPHFYSVLGNHDLHLMSVYYGIKKIKSADRLDDLLNNEQIEVYLEWLRHFPLAKKIDDKTLITHAGLYPYWSFDDALKYAKKVRKRLLQPDFQTFLPKMYTNKPQSEVHLEDADSRRVFAINAMTRMRFLDRNGKLDFEQKCHPDEVDTAYVPWFKLKNKQLLSKQRVIFGHWASLMGETHNKQFIGLDTGYVWGGRMSCLCLETNKITRISAA